MPELLLEVGKLSPLLAFIAIALISIVKINKVYIDFVKEVLKERANTFNDLNDHFKRYSGEVKIKIDDHVKESNMKLDQHEKDTLKRLLSVKETLDHINTLMSIKKVNG